MSRRAIAAVTIAALGGFGLARATQGSSSSPHAPVATTAPVRTPPPAWHDDAPRLALDEDTAATPAREAAPAPVAPATRETTASHQLIDDAIRAHRWTDDDATALRGLLGQMSGDERAEALQALAAAIDSDQLTVEVSGSPI